MQPLGFQTTILELGGWRTTELEETVDAVMSMMRTPIGGEALPIACSASEFVAPISAEGTWVLWLRLPAYCW